LSRSSQKLRNGALRIKSIPGFSQGEPTIHIETELDNFYAERLLELQKHTSKPLPQLVAEMSAKAIDETPAPPETEGQKVLRILEAHQLLGCMESDGRLSVDYKKHLWGNP
jgi:hypothetical protein